MAATSDHQRNALPARYRIECALRCCRVALSFLLALTICPAHAASKASEKWVISEGRSLMSDRSQQLARREALLNAENAALETVILEISSSKSLEINEDAKGHTEAFRNSISTRTYGFIVQKEILAESLVVERATNGGQLPYYFVQLKALIHYEDVSRPSPYEVSVTLNRSTYEAGDELHLSIAVTKPAYIHIFNEAADGTVFILHPHPRQGDSLRLTPGQSRFDFPEEGRTINVYPLPGHDIDHERIRVVVTDTPLLFSPADFTYAENNAGYLPSATMELARLQSKIIQIPFDKRGESIVTYSVRRGKAPAGDH